MHFKKTLGSKCSRTDGVDAVGYQENIAVFKRRNFVPNYRNALAYYNVYIYAHLIKGPGAQALLLGVDAVRYQENIAVLCT